MRTGNMPDLSPGWKPEIRCLQEKTGENRRKVAVAKRHSIFPRLYVMVKLDLSPHDARETLRGLIEGEV